VRLAAVILLVVLSLAAAACGGGGSSSNARLTPSDVERYVLARETVDNLARLLAFIVTADRTVNRLAVAKPGTVRSRTLAQGSVRLWT